MTSGKAVLDPVERVSEVVFGVLMALTFTGSVSVATGGGEIRTLLYAAFGCNIAWGLADAAMYLIGTLTERGRAYTLMRRLHAAAHPDQAHSLIAEALPEGVRQVVGAGELEAMRRRLAELPQPPARARLRRDDYVAAAGIFALVVLATFPVALPFVVFSDPAVAIRTSNAAALATLFLGGWSLGRHAGTRPWRSGVLMAGVGAVLVVVIVALGG